MSRPLIARSFDDRSSRPRLWLRGLIVLALLFVVGFVGLSLWAGSAPKVAIEPALPGIGKRTPIAISIDDVSRATRARVEIVQSTAVTQVVERSFEPRPFWAFWRSAVAAKLDVLVGSETVKGLRSGDATVRTTIERSGSILRTPAPVIAEISLPVRLAPPSLEVVSTQHYVRQGGAEVVVYRVGASSQNDGVRFGSRFFPGFPLPGAKEETSGETRERFAFYAVPYDATSAAEAQLVAIDDIGNQTQRSFVDQFTPRPVDADTIQVDDAFLARVVPEILAQSPEVSAQASPVESYLVINRDLRQKNNAVLVELAAKSAPEILWNQSFQPMANAAITAAFADRRTYVYQGKSIDQQDHLGFDMASVERAPINSSNRGKVVLARYFGIYGNAVVVDHGCGLMSLYGHLSSIDVQDGQTVERGQKLGNSGKTGLAGGDHLHFTYLLQGLPVNPVEWWDAHWIQDRIARKLGAGFVFSGE